MTARAKTAIGREGRQRAELVRLFMAQHLRFTGGRWAGKPFILEPWQWQDMVLPVFGTLDKRGRRAYREALFGLPRWAGKSQIAAGLALALMYTEPVYEGEYYVVAPTKRQAAIVFDKAKRMVNADPQLRAATRVYRQVLELEETGAIFRVLPWDADTAQGYHPTACVIDEYHVHRDASMREAMISGMLGTDNGLLITITTAGAERKGPLWELLGTIRRDSRAYTHWCGAADGDDGADPKVWRRANPARWITLKMLRDQHRTLPFPVFERLHLNRFPSRGTNRAYPADLWHACSSPPLFDPREPCVLGLDASFSRDTTALVMVQRDEKGMHNVWAQVWRKDEAMGHIDHEAVEAKILELSRAYNVVRIACDPNYFTRSMLKLQNEFGLPVEEFPQANKGMSSAAMTLYDLMQEGRIRHGGLRDLTEQVLNAGVKATPYGWRLTKIEDDQKIDAAVALAMAAYVAEAEGDDFGPSFAATGGIRTVQS